MSRLLLDSTETTYLLPQGVVSAGQAPSPTLSLTLAPSGVTTAQAAGTPALTRQLAPTGLAGAGAYGSPQVNRTVLGQGAVTAQTYGQARVDRTLAPTGVASAQAAGMPAVSQTVYLFPAAIPSAWASGTAQVNRIVFVPGALTGQAFGSATAQRTIAPLPVSSAQAAGTPAASPVLSPSGVPTAEAFGVVQAIRLVQGQGVASPAAYGLPLEIRVLTPSGASSSQVFGATVVREPLRPVGVASASTFGQAVSLLTVSPTAVPTAQAMGTPGTSRVLLAQGAASATSVPSPVLTRGLFLVGAVSREAFGAPAVQPALSPSGVATGQAAGSPTLVAQVTPSAVGSAQVLGVPRVAQALGPSGVATPDVAGVPVLTRVLVPVSVATTGVVPAPSFFTRVVPSGVATAEAAGQPTEGLVLGPEGMVSVFDAGSLIISSGRLVPGVPSEETFGLPALQIDLAVSAVGIPSEQAAGTPTQARVFKPAGLVSREAVPVPTAKTSYTVMLLSGQLEGATFFGIPPVVLSGQLEGQGDITGQEHLCFAFSGLIEGRGRTYGAFPDVIYGVGALLGTMDVVRAPPTVQASRATGPQVDWGQDIEPDALALRLTTGSGQPVDVAEITYTLYQVLSTGQLRRVGPQGRTPARVRTGQYAVQGVAGEGGQPGRWLVVWAWRRGPSTALETAQQEFYVRDAIFRARQLGARPVGPRGWGLEFLSAGAGMTTRITHRLVVRTLVATETITAAKPKAEALSTATADREAKASEQRGQDLKKAMADVRSLAQKVEGKGGAAAKKQFDKAYGDIHDKGEKAADAAAKLIKEYADTIGQGYRGEEKAQRLAAISMLRHTLGQWKSHEMDHFTAKDTFAKAQKAEQTFGYAVELESFVRGVANSLKGEHRVDHAWAE